MPVSTDMYNNLKTMDVVGSYEKGLGMRDDMEKRKLAEAERAQQAQLAEAQKAAIIQTPDGKFSFDQNAYGNQLGILAGQGNKIAAQQAMGLGQTMTDRTLADKKYADSLAQQERDNLYRDKSLQSSAADRAESRAERRALMGLTREEKRDTKIDEGVGKLSKDISGVQDGINALDEVEANLGFPLDSAQVQDGKILVNGKAQDLPGVSIPGMGRWSFGDKAQNLQSSAAKVFNTILKDRSGAAVTNTELERLKTEFGEGKYNTESQMVNALQRYKRGVQNELQNREAAYSPEVVNRYTDQGGRTSRSGVQLNGRPSDPIPPKAGKVVEGYRFKGGDASDQNSWEKI